MSTIASNRPFKIGANINFFETVLYWADDRRLLCGSDSTNCTAVALTEQSAAFVSFRWNQPSFPRTQNVNSAVSRLLPACHFSGSIANCATIAAY